MGILSNTAESLRKMGVDPQQLEREVQEKLAQGKSGKKNPTEKQPSRKSAGFLNNLFPEANYRAAVQIPRNVAAGAIGVIPDLVTLVPNLMGAGIPSVTNAVKSGIDYMTGAYTTPQTPIEKNLEAVTEAIAGMGPLGGAAKKIGSVYKTGKAGKALKAIERASEYTPGNVIPTAAASGVTQSILNEDENDVLSAILGGTLAGGVAQKATNATLAAIRASTASGRQTNKALLGKKLGINNKKVNSLIDADMPLTLASVSDSKPVKMFYNMMRNLPFTASDIAEAEERQLLKISDVSGLPQDIAASYTPDIGGKIAIQGVKGQLDNIDRVMAQFMTEIDPLLQWVPTDKRIVNIDIPIKGHKEKLSKVLRGAEIKEIYKGTPIGSQLETLDAQHKKFGGVPYENLILLREELRKKINFGELGNKDQHDLHLLDGQIVESLNSFFDGIGGNAGKLWRKRNATYSKFAKDVKDPLLSHIYKAKNVSDKHAFSKLLSKVKEGVDIEPIYEHLPSHEKQDLTFSILSHLGKNRKGEYNPYTMVNKFRELPKNAQGAILSSYPTDAQDKFKKILDAMEAIHGRVAQENPSGSGYMRNLEEMFKYVKAAGVGTVGALLGGHAGVAAAVAIKAAAPIIFTKYVTKKTLTDPNFIRSIHDAMTVKPDQLPKLFNKLTKRGASGRVVLTELQHFLDGEKSSVETVRPTQSNADALNAQREQLRSMGINPEDLEKEVLEKLVAH